jgi:TRAP-type C4-dicarboxylate transport system permease small subunit
VLRPGGPVEPLSALFGRLLAGLALAGCAVLFAMMLVICADVLFRNVRVLPGVHGVAWANEVTEYALYLITMLTVPWLLRQGQHIRIDILLRAVPRRLAWYCEWLSDLCAFVCCAIMAFCGWKATAASMAIGSMVVKTLAVPEWWLLAPLQASFALLAVEMLFRMQRLYAGERGPRVDAVTAV